MYSLTFSRKKKRNHNGIYMYGRRFIVRELAHTVGEPEKPHSLAAGSWRPRMSLFSPSLKVWEPVVLRAGKDQRQS